MGLFLITCFCLLLYHEIEGITTHSVTGCSNGILLNCPTFQLIHVERITYYNGTDCNQALTDQQVCGRPYTSSDTGLAPACNGFQSCNENLNYCSGSNAARVDYRCIEGHLPKDMCQDVIIDNSNNVFLSTPNYPSRPAFTGVSPCSCSIRGSNISSIQILELKLTSASGGSKTSLEINYDGIIYRTESFNSATKRVYNKRLTTTSAADITLNHNNINNQLLWIEIQGGNFRVRCNKHQEPPFTTTTRNAITTTLFSTSTSAVVPTTRSITTSSATTTRSLTTSSARTSTLFQQLTSRNFNIISTPRNPYTSTAPNRFSIDRLIYDNGQINIPFFAALSLCVLLVLIAVIVIVILCRKGKLVWVKKSPQVETERRLYSGLDMRQRAAGSEGPYQELSARNYTSPEEGDRNPYNGPYEELSARNNTSPEEGDRNPYNRLEMTRRVSDSEGAYQELGVRNSTSPYYNVAHIK